MFLHFATCSVQSRNWILPGLQEASGLPIQRSIKYGEKTEGTAYSRTKTRFSSFLVLAKRNSCVCIERDAGRGEEIPMQLSSQQGCRKLPLRQISPANVTS